MRHGRVRSEIRHCKKQHSGQPACRGFVSVLVLLVLLLLFGLVASQVQRVLKDRRQTRSEQHYLQTKYLASAGLLRADSAKKHQPDYTGEIWNIPPGEIHQTNSASVQIEVSADGVCKVVASYPANTERPNRVTRIRKLSK